MIRQYLSNTNENITIHILQKILKVNKAQLTRVEFATAQAFVAHAAGAVDEGGEMQARSLTQLHPRTDESER